MTVVVDAPTGGTRNDRRRARTRQSLIDAAVARFQVDGVRATTIDQICEEAGVAPRTFFYRFDTREDLFVAISEQRVAQTVSMIEAIIDDPRSFDLRLRDLLLQSGCGLAAEPSNRELVREMLHIRSDDGLSMARAGSIGQATIRLIRRSVRRGEVTSQHRPEVLADLVLGAITSAVTNWSIDPAFHIERELGRSAEALLGVLVP